MKAVTFEDVRKIEYKEVPDIVIPQPNWVKIRVHSAGLCGSDLQKILSYKSPREYLHTFILGHEISGTIEECGSAVEGFNNGDRVAIEPLIPCKNCEACHDGKYELCNNLKTIGKDYPGGFAEYTCAPYTNLFLLPDNMTFNEGALIDPVAVTLHCVHQGEIKNNKSVAIIGDGTIGLCCLQVAKNYKTNLTIIGKHKKNLDLAISLGAMEAFLFEEVKENSRLNNKFDYVIECVGRKQSDTIRLAIDLAKPSGTIIVAGVYDFNYVGKIPLRKLFYKEVKLIGSNSYSIYKDEKEFSMSLRL
ncbi:MAG: alcohol dehydrogenase catalytic domain-containing protein, partial [Candidatus Anstonellales archaeon]